MGENCPTFFLSLCFFWLLRILSGTPIKSVAYDNKSNQKLHQWFEQWFDRGRLL
jgi:hypothetical protein